MKCKKKWVGRELEYILDHGFKLDDDGRILIKESDWNNLSWRDTSINDPSKRTLMIPSDYGCELIIEGLHFVIV